MNSLEKKIETQILNFLKKQNHSLKEYTPGLCLRVYLKGSLKANVRMGKTHKYYDLASLTKIIFTVPEIMKILRKKNTKLNLNLKTPIHSILSWWPTTSPINLTHLLTHTSGLPWWRPVYKECPSDLVFSSPKTKVPSQADQFLKKKLLGFKKKAVGRSVYSDPGFWVLGFLIEELEEKFLGDIWKETPSSSEIYFHLKNKPLFPKNLYAPTGICEWRKKLLCGEVNDRNAWAFGGIAPHAGLFTSIEGLSNWALSLRKKYFSKNASSLIKKFTKKVFSNPQIQWGLGFMKPKNPLGGAGKFFSPSSFGHTGFSGTSLWFDPKKDILIIILSNRTAELEDSHLSLLTKNKRKRQPPLKKDLTLKNTFSEKPPLKKRDRKNETSKIEEKEYDIDIYQTFETKKIQKIKKIPFPNLRREIHNIILKKMK